MQIHGNGRTFAGPADLPDETRDAILAEFEAELSRRDLVRYDRDGKPQPVDGFYAAVRCTGRVRTAALEQGWTPECAERLATVAGDLYGAILGDVAHQARKAR